MDSVQLTNRNSEIVKKFTDPISNLASGVLLSGSNAWGANYAVNQNSDIDLLIIFDDIQKLDKIIDLYVSEGLLNKEEQERLRVFCSLFAEKKAEHFSLVAEYTGVAVSIDFISLETLEKIVSLGVMKMNAVENIPIRVIDEFRSNPPRSAGYSLDDLKGSDKLTYHPKFEEIKNDKDSVVGYLAETLVDGCKEDSYYLGVMSFFLAIKPVVLADRGNRLASAVETMQSNISKIMNNQKPIYITRQERMSEGTLEEVIKSLKGF